MADPAAPAAAAMPRWGKVALGAFSTPEQLAFIHQVYGWMCAGLGTTAVVAYAVAETPALAQIFLGNGPVFASLIVAEFLAVAFLATMVHKIPATAAAAVFVAYAALNGLTLSVIFFVYEFNSIVSVFVITAGIFGVMSVYGYVTKRDLTTLRSFAVMALFGLVLAMLTNLVFRSDTAGLIFACAGVLIFVVLIAGDTQKLKWLYELGRTEGDDGEGKEAINGALTLYLDFVNLFLDLLRILGRRR